MTVTGSVRHTESMSNDEQIDVVPDDTHPEDGLNPVDENATTADPVDDDVADETKAWPPAGMETK